MSGSHSSNLKRLSRVDSQLLEYETLEDDYAIKFWLPSNHSLGRFNNHLTI